MTPDWMDDARCRDSPVDLFFPAGQGNTAGVRWAKAICNTCPVRQECLDYAIVNREKYGVWGGMSVRERRRYIRLLNR